MTVRSRFLLGIGVFLGLLLATAVALQVWVEGARHDTHVVNVAGRQRMLAQAAAKEALLASQGDPDAPDRLRQARDRFARTLHGLKDGDAAEALPATRDADARARLGLVEAAWADYDAVLDAVARGTEPASRLHATGERVIDAADAVVQRFEEIAEADVRTLQWLVVGVVVLALVAGAYGWWSFRRRVLVRLADVERGVLDIAERRDLTARLPEEGEDEIANISRAFNRMQSLFREVGVRTRDATVELHGQVTGLVALAEQTKRRIVSEVGEVEALAGAMNQMTANMAGVARSAGQASDVARRALEEVGAGRGDVERGAEAVRWVAGQLDAVAAAVDRLRTSAEDVGSIVKVIDDIAERTTMLALNAAIEAEHAGESGRGFAVVAREVRALAQWTQKSTKDVQERISRVQHGARAAVDAMRAGGSRAVDSVARAEALSVVLEGIDRAVQQMSEVSGQVALAAGEHAQAARSVNRNLQAIRELTADTSRVGTQTVDHGARLSALANELQALVAQLVV